MQEKKVLGRGISSLIRNNPTQTPKENTTPYHTPSAGEIKEPSKDKLQEVALSKVRVNPQNPRRYFDEVALEELSASIKNTGLLQPILVRVVDDHYEIIAGERRFRASKMAGLTVVPIVVRESDDLNQLELALIENLQRQDLSPIEEAQGYDRLATSFSLTQEQIAKKVGKERSTVANLVRLLKLPPAVQKMINMKELSMGHARALLSLDSPKQQEETAHLVFDKNLSVRQTEKLIQVLQKMAVVKQKPTEVKQDINLKYFADQIQQRLGTKVEIKTKGKGGEIVVKYFSQEDLNRILQVLKPR